MVSVETFRELALSFPGAKEQPHFDNRAFSVNKIFATIDHKKNIVCLMLSEIDQSVFCAFDKSVFYPVPNKWGKTGATYVELKTVRKVMLKDALTQAYKKCVTEEPKNRNKIK